MTPKAYFMTAKEYLTEKARMTECRLNPECENCGLGKKNNGMNIGCVDLEVDHPDKAIAIVAEWSATHPRKTYKDDFLEKFPKARINSINDVPWSCKYGIYGINSGICDRHGGIEKCADCWNEPME